MTTATRTTPDVIFFGHGLVADQIRRNLTDLATLGLIDPFTWIDPRLPETGATARRISSEGSKLTGIDHILRSVDGTLLFVALDIEDDLTSGLDMAAVDRWTGSIETRLSAASSPARVRTLLPRLPRGGRIPSANHSWPTTVAIAPEDSEAPGAPRAPVCRADDPTAAAQIAAPALCGLTGLWSSEDMCPLLDADGRPLSTGGAYQVRLARSYHRTIDASAVEDRLRREASDIQGQLPQPTVEGHRQVEHMGSSERIPEAMANRLLNTFHQSLATPMQEEARREYSRKTGLAAAGAFLKAYFKDGLGSPKKWWDAAQRNARDAVDDNIQKTLYGEDSPVRVISNPAAGPAQELTLDQLEVAASRHRQQAMQQNVRVGDAPQLADMWQAYRGVALTLVDGSERNQGTLATPADHYGNRRIVEQGWQSVPDVDDSFHGFHPLLGQQLGMSPEQAVIRPFDTRGAEIYEQGLNFVAGQTREPAIRQLQQNFVRWKETASRSFAWHTGDGLRRLLAESRYNVTDQMRKYDENRGKLGQLQERDQESLNRQYRNSTRFHVALGITLTLFVILSVVIHHKENWQLSFYSGFDWMWAVLWLVLGALAICISHMFRFALARRGVESYLQDSWLLKENVRITGQNITQAMDNCDRQVKAYRQLLSWSTLLGRAISRPLGRDFSARTDLESPSAGLPLSTGVGQAAVPGTDLGPLVSRARNELFPANWADAAFASLLDDTAADFAHRNSVQPPSVNQLFSESGAGTGSNLDKLATWSVSSAMEHRDHTRERWSQVVTDPRFAGELSDRISSVEFFHNGQATTTSKERFLATLRRENPASGSFLQDTLSTVAVNDRATTMDESVCRLDYTGDRDTTGTITRSATLVQFGRVTSLDNLGAGVDRTDTGVTETPELPTFEELAFGTADSEAPTFTAPRSDTLPSDTPDWDSLI